MNIFTVLLVQPLTNGLVLFYRIFGENMGTAIVLFSVFLKFALYPLTKSSLENMKKMAELKPHLDKLRHKHKGDRQKFMKAQADFYKEKGFNPASGCVPQILQLVVLYAFLQVFSKILTHGGSVVDSLNPLLYEPLKFAPGTVIHTAFLYLDITKPDVFHLPGISVPIPGPLLLLSAVAQFVSAKMAAPILAKEEKIAKKTEDQTDDALVASQQSMFYMLPFITIIFGMQFASGLALYWFVFSAVQAYQQYRVAGLGGLSPLLQKVKLLAKQA
jgi:YidC/Oxa1 family membrane protein insertase